MHNYPYCRGCGENYLEIWYENLSVTKYPKTIHIMSMNKHQSRIVYFLTQTIILRQISFHSKLCAIRIDNEIIAYTSYEIFCSANFLNYFVVIQPLLVSALHRMQGLFTFWRYLSDEYSSLSWISHVLLVLFVVLSSLLAWALHHLLLLMFDLFELTNCTQI